MIILFIFFPSPYKFKRFLLKYCVAIITPGFTGRLFSNPDLTNALFFGNKEQTFLGMFVLSYVNVLCIYPRLCLQVGSA